MPRCYVNSSYPHLAGYLVASHSPTSSPQLLQPGSLPMTWLELEQLTQQLRTLPMAARQAGWSATQVLLSAHSTRIEGSRVTVPEAFDFFRGGRLAAGRRLADYDMLRDHAHALEWTLHRAGERQLPGPKLLRDVAAAVLHTTGRPVTTILGTVDPARGELRRSDVFIVGAAAFPNAQQVPALVAAFVAELRTRLPATVTMRAQLELAFEAHLRLVDIHPFLDGNGRTARLLMNYVQHYHGLPLTVVCCEDRPAYFAALQQSRTSGELGAFHEFMRAQHGKSLQQQLHLASRTSKVPDKGRD